MKKVVQLKSLSFSLIIYMPFNINVQSLSNPVSSFSISVETTTTIVDLKAMLMVQELYNYNLNYLHLFNGGTEIHNSLTLGSYGISGIVSITSFIGDYYVDPNTQPQFVAIPPDSAGERRKKILTALPWYGYVN